MSIYDERPDRRSNKTTTNRPVFQHIYGWSGTCGSNFNPTTSSWSGTCDPNFNSNTSPVFQHTYGWFSTFNTRGSTFTTTTTVR